MGAQRIVGTVAVISAAGLLVLAIATSVAGLAWNGSTTATGTVMGPGMMSGGSGPAMMGTGPMGMMGGPGMGPGTMGGAHMGYGQSTQGTTAPIADAPTVTVTATEFRLSPNEITLSASATNLTLKNDGAVLHDLTIPTLGVRVIAAPGETTTVGLRDLAAGTYSGYCSVLGHAEAGMRVTVVVQ